MSLLHNVREKSDATKKRIAAGGAVVVTAVIVGVWSSTLPARFEMFAELSQKDDEVTAVQRNASSFSDLVSNVKSQVGAVTESLPKKEKETVLSPEPKEDSSVRIKAVTKPETKTEQTTTSRYVRIATTSPSTVKSEE